MTGPGQTMGVSVFIDELIADLGLSRSETSLAYLLGTLTGAFAMPLVGKSIDRYGARTVLTVAGAGFALTLLGLANARGFLTLALGFVGIRMLGQGALTLTATTAVALWFERRRGFAIGLATSFGLGLMSLSPVLLIGLIERAGWRTAWVVASLVVAAVVVPIGWLGMRDSPEALGLARDGASPPDPDGNRQDRRAAPERAPSFTRAQAMRTLLFWAVVGAVGTSGLVSTALTFHVLSVLGEQGLTPAQAAATVVPQILAMLTGVLVGGMLADRFSAWALVAVSMAALATAMVSVQFVEPGWSVVAYALLLGTGSGLVRSVEAAGFPHFFGVDYLGEIRGLAMGIHVGATALGPYILAVGFEQFGSYAPVLLVLTILPVTFAVLTAVARVPVRGVPAARDTVVG